MKTSANALNMGRYLQVKYVVNDLVFVDFG